MNRINKFFTLLLLSGFLSVTAGAQDQQTPVIRKNENIVIHENGNNKEKLTIVIDSDKVTVNGKPADAFKDKGITILRDENNDLLSNPGSDFGEFMPRGGVQMFQGDMAPMHSNPAFLGVTTVGSEAGVKINGITPNSPADKAGLKEGDVITKVGDTKISSYEDLYKTVGQYKPGDKVTITFLRDGKENSADAILEKNPAAVFGFNKKEFQMFPPGQMSDLQNFSFDFAPKPRLGIQVQDTEDGHGVKVLGVNDASPAAKAGLKEDDLITEANGKTIKSVDDLKTETKDLKGGDAISLKIKRDQKYQTLEVKIPKELKITDL